MKKYFFLFLTLFITCITNAQLNAEQSQIRKTFFDFLKFYQKNEKKFHSFKLYKGMGEEDGPPFHIQWKEVERYCAWLKTNVPYVSEEYIKNEKNDFKYYDSSFKADPDEEIPIGFDYDRWAGGQEEIGYMIQWYTSSKNKYEVTITGNTALLRIGGELWEGAKEKDRTWSEVPFIKEKGKWKMATNIHPSDDR
jgi:hypothetical protein